MTEVMPFFFFLLNHWIIPLARSRQNAKDVFCFSILVLVLAQLLSSNMV